MKVGIVAAAACVPCPAWATRPKLATRPVTGVLPGSVIWARPPFLTAPCCDASRSTRTCSLSEVAVSDRSARPGRSTDLAGDLRDPDRLGQEDRVSGGELAGHAHAPLALERPERLLGPGREGAAAGVQVAVELADVRALLPTRSAR